MFITDWKMQPQSAKGQSGMMKTTMRSPHSLLQAEEVLSAALLWLPLQTLHFLHRPLWTISNGFISFLHCSAQTCPWDSRWGHASPEQSGTISSLAQLGMLCLMSLLAARELLTPAQLATKQDPTGPFPQHCSPPLHSSHVLVYTHSESSTCHCY